MTGKKKNTAQYFKRVGSDMKKVDAYVLTQKDYDEIPELTDDFFRHADLHIGGKLVQRGRPRLADPKEAVSMRLDPEVIAHFRRSGRGWQSRINALLRKAAKLPTVKRKKA
jgi:uncharacterized protein (DUF4415 family)